MKTPVRARASQSFCQKSPLTPASTPNSAVQSLFLNQVLLHDWWLIRTDSDSHGKRMGIGGFTFERCKSTRRFSSAPIVKRQDAVTLKTDDGITIMLHGYLNKSQTLENGISHEVCNHFLIGFPYYWEEFADLSDNKERDDFNASNGVPCSDADKTTSPGDHVTNTPIRNTFVSTPCEASRGKKETSPAMQSKLPMDHKKTSEKKRRARSNVGMESDADKTTSPGDHGTNTPIRNTFEFTPCEALHGKKKTSPSIQSKLPTDHKKTSEKKRRARSNVGMEDNGPRTRRDYKERDDFNASNGVPCSDADKTTSPGDHGTNTPIRNTFESTPCEASRGKKKTPPSIQSKLPTDHKKTSEKKRRARSNVRMEESGPPTRSKKSSEKEMKSHSNVRVEDSGPWTRSKARGRARDDQTKLIDDSEVI